jgi:DNA polymerase-3 subunit epsilon
MTRAIFYDTETSGLPQFEKPSEDPGQPHIVQLGACLVDIDTRKVLSTLDVIVRPEGWVIPDEVARVHGITTEMALEVGISESLAVELLLEMTKQAEFRVAHNESFDQRIVRIACKRFFEASNADEWKAGKVQCTAQLSTPILKLPPTARMVAAGRKHSKTPNLGEAYRYFTGRDLVGAHSALVDVHACMEVWFAIQALRQPEAVTA